MLTNESCIADVIEYKRLKEEAKAIEEKCEALRDRILRYMDQTGKSRVGNENVTAMRYTQFQSRVDVKRLEIDHPELVGDYRYEKRVDFLKVL